MPTPWHITAGQTPAWRLPGGKCSRSFANCTPRSRGGINFTLVGGFQKPSMTYRGVPDCLWTAFYSYGIKGLEHSRG